MKITQDMVAVFNSMLKDWGCVFRLELTEEFSVENPACEIVLTNDMFVESFIVNPNKEFYAALENFFKERNIELTYNNTGSVFWSRSGWSIE